MHHKAISKSEWNRKIAINRWNNISKKINQDILKKEEIEDYKRLKAKLLGFLAGDGGVYIRVDKNKDIHHSILFCPDDESMLNHFVDAFIRFYNKKPTIRNHGNYFRVRAASKPICLDLLKTAKFGTHEWRVPNDYLTSNILKIEWLRAFFDCEGYVGKKQIQLQSVNKQGLTDICNLLNKFSIHSKIYQYERKNPNWNTNYILCILRKESIRKFYNIIGFNHSEKLRKINQLIFASVPESG
ncbi:MAG: hypothetical protein KJ601_05915 [Nanoarchaeota archaeon]|nr:hypothetical protein [Nanoarchaeota archaeon]